MPAATALPSLSSPRSFAGTSIPACRPRPRIQKHSHHPLPVQHIHSESNLGIGNNDLPSTGYNSGITETTTPDQRLPDHLLQDHQRDPIRIPAPHRQHHHPFSTAPTILVQGAFTGGGDIRGGRAPTTPRTTLRSRTTPPSPSPKTSSASAVASAPPRTPTPPPPTPTASSPTPAFANYAANILDNYQVTAIPHPTVSARTTDVGLYAETDWKVRPNFTFSYGLRFETQNFIHDHKDFAPRLSAAYGLNKRTVLRAGGGLFYDRFMLANQLNTVRNNGVNQQQFTVSSTNTAIPTTCTPATPASCPPPPPPASPSTTSPPVCALLTASSSTPAWTSSSSREPRSQSTTSTSAASTSSTRTPPTPPPPPSQPPSHSSTNTSPKVSSTRTSSSPTSTTAAGTARSSASTPSTSQNPI